MRKRPDLPEQINPETGQPIPGTGVSNQWEYYVMFDGSSLGQIPGTMVAIGGGFMQFTDDGKFKTDIYALLRRIIEAKPAT